jgi:hypothetical protein
LKGVYTAHVSIPASALAAKTLLYGTNGANTVLEILSAAVTNTDQEITEQVSIAITRVTTPGSPVGATTVFINKAESGSPTTAVAWLGNLSTEPTSYNSDHIDIQGVVNMGGYYYDPMPETRKYIAPGGAFGIRLLNAISNSTAIIAQITYREIG